VKSDGKVNFEREELFICYKNCKAFAVFKFSEKGICIKQALLRSGTSIGALIREAEFGQSKVDFIHKMSIALKEANETEYWLCLLKDTGYIELHEFDSIQADVKELIAMLISTVNTSKNRLK
jgi:four helix bundle protein